jgi:hypothetical protein
VSLSRGRISRDLLLRNSVCTENFKSLFRPRTSTYIISQQHRSPFLWLSRRHPIFWHISTQNKAFVLKYRQIVYENCAPAFKINMDYRVYHLLLLILRVTVRELIWSNGGILLLEKNMNSEFPRKHTTIKSCKRREFNVYLCVFSGLRHEVKEICALLEK